MCAYKRKTWRQKLEDGRQPHVEVAGKAFAGITPGQKMLIPTPKLIDAYIRQIPEGKAVDSQTLRKDLALQNGAEVTCPLTTGIFLRIVAEAAQEAYEKGESVDTITPFWRVITEKSPIAKKLTFGTQFLKEQRKKEEIGQW
ncbi:hypothetical protein HRG84_07910 [Flavisolibacter sp. BT320]|nr:hypothetical protein [Flavisolibacter longurius]